MGRLSAYAKNRILKLRFKKNKRIIHIVEILKKDDNIKVSRQAVSTFLKKYLETNSIYDKPRTGRKRKLTQEEIQLIGQVTRLNRDITARAIKEYLNLNVSTYTILRATKLFEWNKINPNSNDSKKAAALERQLNGGGNSSGGELGGNAKAGSKSKRYKRKQTTTTTTNSNNTSSNNESGVGVAGSDALDATGAECSAALLNESGASSSQHHHVVSMNDSIKDESANGVGEEENDLENKNASSSLTETETVDFNKKTNREHSKLNESANNGNIRKNKKLEKLINYYLISIYLILND
jgi:transposase